MSGEEGMRRRWMPARQVPQGLCTQRACAWLCVSWHLTYHGTWVALRRRVDSRMAGYNWAFYTHITVVFYAYMHRHWHFSSSRTALIDALIRGFSRFPLALWWQWIPRS